MIPKKAAGILEHHCLSCHEVDSKKGDIRLDHLLTLSLTNRLDLLNKMHEQLYLESMPPRKKKVQPSALERQDLIEWISREFTKHHASKLDKKLPYPEYGNYVNHDQLFSG